MNVVGIDVGQTAVKAIVLDTKRGAQIARTLSVPILRPEEPSEPAEGLERPTEPGAPGPAAASEAIEGGPEGVLSEAGVALDPLAEALRELARLLGEDADGPASALPGTRALAAHIGGLPFADPSKVEKILPGLLADRLPLSLSELVYGFLVQRRPAEIEALAVYARRSDLGAFLGELGAAGINPSSVEMPELAYRHLLAGALSAPGAPGCVAVLDLGEGGANLLVVEGGRVAAARRIAHGAGAVTDAIAARFQVDRERAEQAKRQSAAILDDEARSGVDEARQILSDASRDALTPLVRALARSLRALAARERIEVERIYLTGGGAWLRGIEGFLRAELGVEVEPLPLTVVERAPELTREPDSEHALALGLALGLAADRNESLRVNLRRGEFAYRGRSGYVRARIVRLAMVAGLLLVLGMGAALAKSSAVEARREAVRAELSAETKKVFGKPLYSAKKIKAAAGASAKDELSFAPRMSAYELFYELIQRLGAENELTLRRIEVRADGNLVQIMGSTTKPEIVDEIVEDLETLECLKSVKKDKVQVRAEDRADFELQIASDCS